MKSFSLPLQNDVAQPDAPAPAQRRALNRRGPAPLALEPRVMFDGATADAAVAAAKTVAAEVPTAMAAERSDALEAYVAPAVQAAAQGRQEIIFVEDNISDLGALLRAVPAGVEIVVLDHTRDGLQQMIAALDGRAPVDAIHLVTHGRAGQIELGTSVLDSAGLDRYAAALGELGGKLSADGDLLFYGCDLAASADGQDLVERIGQLTGADVAASTDRTGSSGYGNWILEARSGAVEAAPMELDRAGWTGELDTSTTYNANWLPLSFNNTTAVIGTGVNNGDVVRFNNVITLNGQVVDAVVTTTISGTTISSYDSLSNPSSNGGYFQPNLNTTAVGGNATFTISFYKGGSYTGAGTGTAVTLQNVVVNSYDIDSLGSGADRQFQSFKGFARYELAKSTFLVPSVQADGTVTFLYTTNNPQNNPSSSFAADAYRVRVYYDSMSTFEVNAGVAGAKAQAYFAFDFSVGPSWTGETTVTGNPAPILSYSTINFAEAAANDGAIVTTSTITLSNGTFTGTNGQSLPGVGFSNLPAGLSAQLIRTSDTTAVLSFTGNATAHANANDISNLGISFGNTAFTSGNAGAVTGASRFDLTIDFADPPADASAPVVAAGQVFSYAENRADGTLLGTVSASDNVGVTGFRFGATGTTTSADGYFSIGNDGKVRLTTTGAAANAASNDYENGANSFTHGVQARDAAGNWSAAVNLVLSVTNIDEQAPLFTSGTTASVVEGQAVLYTASANDNLDFTDKVVSYAIKPGAGDANLLAIHTGTGVVRLASGNLDAGAKSSYTFTVVAQDATGNLREQAVTVAVTYSNGAPVAGAASITIAEDNIHTGALPAASDPDGDPVSYALATGAQHGSVQLVADGSYTYTPAANYHGTDSFTYTVSDGKGASNTYTVNITVTPVNDAPVAGGTSISTAEDTARTGSLPVASDADGDTVTYAKASDPAHGTVSIDSDGKYTYTPDANYHGTDSFSYTVSDGKGGSNTYTVNVTVTPVNDLPVAGNTSFTTAEDTVKSGRLPAASDADGDTVTYAKASDPAHGAVTIASDGTYAYTPAANYHGTDSFTYTVSDGQGGSNTYTVNVTVTPVNDLPVAGNTNITTAEDT
ncbi:tandem-95 repeat protein, partial [Massilia sp. MS-15]|uniref:tandem-95 repeat protein n=1 Tax=Massilia sp. MS-15 TaxID=2878200 RepID=UPI001CD529A0